MSTQPTIDPQLDLTLSRVIRAPRALVWRAWADPDRFAQWWLPAPTQARVDRLELRPCGALITRMSDDGIEFLPHMNALFLAVEEEHQLIFTNALDSTLRPANPAPVAMTATITMRDHPDGTSYEVVVRHRAPEDRALHEELGFFDGWGSVTDGLTALAEREHAKDVAPDGE